MAEDDRRSRTERPVEDVDVGAADADGDGADADLSGSRRRSRNVLESKIVRAVEPKRLQWPPPEGSGASSSHLSCAPSPRWRSRPLPHRSRRFATDEPCRKLAHDRRAEEVAAQAIEHERRCLASDAQRRLSDGRDHRRRERHPVGIVERDEGQVARDLQSCLERRAEPSLGQHAVRGEESGKGPGAPSAGPAPRPAHPRRGSWCRRQVPRRTGSQRPLVLGCSPRAGRCRPVRCLTDEQADSLVTELQQVPGRLVRPGFVLDDDTVAQAVVAQPVDLDDSESPLTRVGHMVRRRRCRG